MSESAVFPEDVELENLLEAKDLAGRARVKFEKENNATYIVFVRDHPIRDSSPNLRIVDTEANPQPISEETVKQNMQTEDSSDAGSIWSVNLPEKHSAKIAGIVGWVFVAWTVIMNMLNTVAIILQDGSAAWAILLAVCQILSFEIPFFFLPFLFCVCPSVWPAVWFSVALETAFLVDLILFYTLPFFKGEFPIGNIIGVALFIIIIIFSRRIHFHFKSYHKKGSVLEMTVSMFRYYAILSVADVIKNISGINSITANGALMITRNQERQEDENSTDFAYISVLFIFLTHLQYYRYPQARHVFDLIGVMKSRDFIPFGLICVQLIIFVVTYVAAFSNIVQSSTVTTVVTAVFDLLLFVTAVQIVALSTRNPWLSWLV